MLILNVVTVIRAIAVAVIMLMPGFVRDSVFVLSEKRSELGRIAWKECATDSQNINEVSCRLYIGYIYTCVYSRPVEKGGPYTFLRGDGLDVVGRGTRQTAGIVAHIAQIFSTPSSLPHGPFIAL